MVIFEAVLQYLGQYSTPHWNLIEVEELIRNPLIINPSNWHYDIAMLSFPEPDVMNLCLCTGTFLIASFVKVNLLLLKPKS